MVRTKILGRAFLKNVVPKESFIVASDVVPVLYNKPYIYVRD